MEKRKNYALSSHNATTNYLHPIYKRKRLRPIEAYSYNFYIWLLKSTFLERSNVNLVLRGL